MSLLASFLLSMMNGFVKELSTIMGTGEIAFFRGAFGVIFILLLMWQQKRSFSNKDRFMLITRGVFGGIGMYCYFVALSGMALADVSIIAQLSAFFVLFFAALFLNEKLPKGVLWPILIIVAGMCVIVRPWEYATFSWYALAALGGAFFSAAAYTTIRNITLAGGHDEMEIVFYFLASATVVGGIVMAQENIVAPTGYGWFLIIGMSVVSLLAQICLTKAYGKTNPVLASFVQYSGVFFNALIGFVIFDEWLSTMTILGGIGIIGGSIYLTRLKSGAVQKR